MSKNKVNLDNLFQSKEAMADFEPSEKITCTARTVMCFLNQGHNNFKILTIKIVEGIVKAVEYSDPYASFETLTRIELAENKAIINLNSNWVDKKCLSQ